MPVLTGDNSFCAGGSASISVKKFSTYIWSDNSTGQTLNVTIPGTYTVTVTDVNNCTGIATTQISENTIATPSIVGNQNFCEGGSTSLSLNTTYDTYLLSLIHISEPTRPY